MVLEFLLTIQTSQTRLKSDSNIHNPMCLHKAQRPIPNAVARPSPVFLTDTIAENKRYNATCPADEYAVVITTPLLPYAMWKKKRFHSLMHEVYVRRWTRFEKKCWFESWAL